MQKRIPKIAFAAWLICWNLKKIASTLKFNNLAPLLFTMNLFPREFLKLTTLTYF